MFSGRMEAQNNAILGLTKELDTIEKDIKKVEEEIAKNSNEQGTLEEKIAMNSNEQGTLEEKIAKNSNEQGTLEEKIAMNFNKLETLQNKPLNKRKNDEKREIEYLRQEDLYLRGEAAHLRKEEAHLREIEILLLEEAAHLRKEEADLRKMEILLLEEKKRADERRSVREALPALGKYPFLSFMELCTSTGHCEALVVEGNFPVVEDTGSPRKQYTSMIWNSNSLRREGALRWSTLGSICQIISDVFKDVTRECNLNSLWVIQEMGTFELHRNIWLVYLSNTPVGVMVVKKPGDGVLENKFVMGEVYDYLMHLHNYHGLEQMIGIVTTYREWRVCWLDTNETNALVHKPVSIPLEEVSANRTETKRKWTDYHRVAPSKMVADSESSVVCSPRERKMFVSRIWSIEKDNVFPLIASALIKMSQVTHCCFSHPFEDLSGRSVLHVNTNSFYWDYLDHRKVQYGVWNECPPPNTKDLYLLADLGSGGNRGAFGWPAVEVVQFVYSNFSSVHMRRLRDGVI